MSKKLFQIMNSNPQLNKGKITVDGRELKFHNKTNTFQTHDEGLANEIKAQFNQRGRSAMAMVNEVPQSMTKVYEGTRHQHSYFFSVPDLPWKKEGQNAKEIRESPETTGKKERSERRTRKRLRLRNAPQDWVDSE